MAGVSSQTTPCYFLPLSASTPKPAMPPLAPLPRPSANASGKGLKITAPSEGLIMNNSFLNPHIEVRTKSNGAKGVFATAPIEQGEIVAIGVGDFVTRHELSRLPEDIQRESLQVAPEIYQVSSKEPDKHPETLDAFEFIGHSCDPNLAIVGNNVCIARKNISPGEELRYDYGTTDTAGNPDRGWMCDCGKPNCRGITTDIDYRYLIPTYGAKMVPRYVERLYEKDMDMIQKQQQQGQKRFFTNG